MSHAIEQFFASWGEPDPDTRAAALHDCLPTKVSYADPRTPEAITDLDALITYVAMFSQYAPGATAHVSNLSATQGTYRANVEFRMPDGKAQAGQYFIEVDDQSRPYRMVGFVGVGEPE